MPETIKIEFDFIIKKALKSVDKLEKSLKGFSKQSIKNVSGLDKSLKKLEDVKFKGKDDLSPTIDRINSKLDGIVSEIDVELTAKDDASEIIEETQESLESIDGEEAEVSVEAEDEATDALEDVSDELDSIDGETAEVEIAALDDATDIIEGVADDLDSLDGSSAEVSIGVSGGEEMEQGAESANDLGGALGTAASAMATVTGIKFIENQQEASKSILLMTGATGEQNDALMETVIALRKSGYSWQESTDMVGNLNTMLGLTGPELEDVSRHALVSSQKTGDGISDTISFIKSLQAEGTKDVDDITRHLDMLGLASEASALSGKEIMKVYIKSAPYLRQLGISMEDYIALLVESGASAKELTKISSGYKDLSKMIGTVKIQSADLGNEQKRLEDLMYDFNQVTGVTIDEYTKMTKAEKEAVEGLNEFEDQTATTAQELLKMANSQVKVSAKMENFMILTGLTAKEIREMTQPELYKAVEDSIVGIEEGSEKWLAWNKLISPSYSDIVKSAIETSNAIEKTELPEIDVTQYEKMTPITQRLEGAMDGLYASLPDWSQYSLVGVGSMVTLVGAIKTIIIPFLTKIGATGAASFLTGLGGNISAGLSGAFGGISSSLSGLVTSISSAFSSALSLAAPVALGTAIGLIAVKGLHMIGFMDKLAEYGEKLRSTMPALSDALKILLAPIGIVGAAINGLVTDGFGGMVRESRFAVEKVNAAFVSMKDRVKWNLTDMTASFSILFERFRYLGTEMYTSGRALMDNFLSGLKSKLGEIRATVENIVGEIRDYLPFSPAKIGPLSELPDWNSFFKIPDVTVPINVPKTGGMPETTSTGYNDTLEINIENVTLGEGYTFDDFVADMRGKRVQRGVKL